MSFISPGDILTVNISCTDQNKAGDPSAVTRLTGVVLVAHASDIAGTCCTITLATGKKARKAELNKVTVTVKIECQVTDRPATNDPKCIAVYSRGMWWHVHDVGRGHPSIFLAWLADNSKTKQKTIAWMGPCSDALAGAGDFVGVVANANATWDAVKTSILDEVASAKELRSVQLSPLLTDETGAPPAVRTDRGVNDEDPGAIDMSDIDQIAETVANSTAHEMDLLEDARKRASVKPQVDASKRAAKARVRGKAAPRNSRPGVLFEHSGANRNLVQTFPDGSNVPTIHSKRSITTAQPQLGNELTKAYMSMLTTHRILSSTSINDATFGGLLGEYRSSRAAVAAAVGGDGDAAAALKQYTQVGYKDRKGAYGSASRSSAATTAGVSDPADPADPAAAAIELTELDFNGGPEEPSIVNQVQLAKTTGLDPNGAIVTGTFDPHGIMSYGQKHGTTGRQDKTGDVTFKHHCNFTNCGFSAEVIYHGAKQTTTVKSMPHTHGDSLGELRESGLGSKLFLREMRQFIAAHKGKNPNPVEMMMHAKSKFGKTLDKATKTSSFGIYFGAIDWDQSLASDIRMKDRLARLKSNYATITNKDKKEKFTRSTKLVTGSESIRIEVECKKVVEENSKSRMTALVTHGEMRQDQLAYCIEAPEEVFKHDSKENKTTMLVHIVNPFLLERAVMATPTHPGGLTYLRIDSDHAMGFDDSSMLNMYSNTLVHPGGQGQQLGLRAHGTLQTALAAEHSLWTIEASCREFGGSLRSRIGVHCRDGAKALGNAYKKFYETSPITFVEHGHMYDTVTKKCVEIQFSEDGSCNYDPERHMYGPRDMIQQPEHTIVVDAACLAHFFRRMEEMKSGFFQLEPPSVEGVAGALTVDNGAGDDERKIKKKISKNKAAKMIKVLAQIEETAFDRTTLAFLVAPAMQELCRLGLGFNAAKLLASDYKGFDWIRDRTLTSPTTNAAERGHKDIKLKQTQVAEAEDQPIDKNKSLATGACLEIAVNTMSNVAPLVWNKPIPDHTYDYEKMPIKKKQILKELAAGANQYLNCLTYGDSPKSKPKSGDGEHLIVYYFNDLPPVATKPNAAAVETQLEVLKCKDAAEVAASDKASQIAASKLLGAFTALANDNDGVDQHNMPAVGTLQKHGTIPYAIKVVDQLKASQASSDVEREKISDAARQCNRTAAQEGGGSSRKRLVAPQYQFLKKYRKQTRSNMKLTAKQYEDKVTWAVENFMGEKTFSAPHRASQHSGVPYERTFEGCLNRLTGLSFLVEDETATPENGRLPLVCSCKEYADSGGYCVESLGLSVFFFGFKAPHGMSVIQRDSLRDQNIGTEFRCAPTPAGVQQGLPKSRLTKTLKVKFPAKLPWAGKPFDLKQLAGPQKPAVSVDDVVSVCFTDDKTGSKFWRRGTVKKPTASSTKDGSVRVSFPDKSAAEVFPADFFFRMNMEHNWRHTK